LILWVSLSDEFEILYIQLFFLVALPPPFPLLVFDTGIIFVLVVIFINDETFADLC
jgi:hypothetical protein